MKKFIIIFGLFFLSYCSFSQQENDNSLIQKETNFAPIDTVSLSIFWDNFKYNLHVKNKKKIIDVLEFPIHAEFFVDFQFAYDCDIETFKANEKKYSNFYIDKNNIEKYYDFVFSKPLKEMIAQTTVKDLLEKGERFKNHSGMVYHFFPQYFYQYARENCPYDISLNFIISFENDKWGIIISGLF